MAIAYPLTLDGFMRALPVRGVTFALGETTTQSGTGGGEILSASRGDALWGGKVVVGLRKDQDGASAVMDLARQVGATFFVSDPKRKWLQAHKGQELTATISAVDAGDRRRFTLSGLADGVTLTNGDHLSFSYGSTPERHYLGKVVEGGAVSGSSIQISVLPFLPLGLAVGGTVQLHSPVCLGRYVPESFEPIERVPGYDSGFSFKWRQTKR